MDEVLSQCDVHAPIDKTQVQLSGRKKLLFAVGFCALLVVLLGGIAELGLRLTGHRPWRIKKIMWEVQPGGTFFTKHARLGYTLLPGQFTVTWHPRFSFTATHLDPALTGLDHPVRATHPLDTYDPASTRPEIWVFGCSWAYGSRLDDEETFGWLLQERLPQYEVVNLAVSGYGTLHSFIQFKGALAQRPAPAAVVLTYASFHDERNTFLRARRKTVAPYCRLGPIVQPYARTDRHGALHYSMATVGYTEFPLMRRSALMHQAEIWYNGIEDRFCHSHAVSRAILREAANVCDQKNIPLVVAGIASDPSTRGMLDDCRARGILTANISVDMTVPANTLMPYDRHPSARANRHYAHKLETFLRDAVLDDSNRRISRDIHVFAPPKE